jgi:hypothetical protein
VGIVSGKRHPGVSVIERICFKCRHI